jgi:hypothetical protein
MRTELLQSVLARIPGLPLEELPSLLGELETLRATIQLRMTAPAAAVPVDEALGIDAAANRMSVSTDYLYRHAKQLPFAYREGRSWRFSANGIAEHIRRKTAVLTARRH